MRNYLLEQAESLTRLRFIKKQGETKGKVPGELVFVGDQKQDFVRMRVFAFDEKNILEKEITHLKELDEIQNNFGAVWLNVDGLHDTDRIEKVKDYFQIPNLISEDIVHTGQRPKFNELPEATFFLLKMLSLDEKQHILEAEQFSMFQKSKVLITFQEKVGDVLDPVRDRIRNRQGRICSAGVDYLAYCLADAIIDNYIFIMEYFAEKIEVLEDRIILQPDANVLAQINRYKVELNYFRKTIRPAREAVANWKKSGSSLVLEETKPFLEDLDELIQRAYDNVENYKAMLTEQLSVYSTNVNNKMNDIMKVLTIFSALFIPLTFIAGIYGTNFEYFPELKFKYSYFVMWAVMITLAVVMLIYFKRKKWF